MSVTPQQRALWTKRLLRLTEAARRAQDDVLVAIHEATVGGVSQADIAYMIGARAPSGIKAKAGKGKAIAEARRRA